MVIAPMVFTKMTILNVWLVIVTLRVPKQKLVLEIPGHVFVWPIMMEIRAIVVLQLLLKMPMGNFF